LNLIEFDFYSFDSNPSPVTVPGPAHQCRLSPVPTPVVCLSCECRGRAAAGHTAPRPQRRPHAPPPPPRCHVAPLVDRPPLPAVSPIMGAPSPPCPLFSFPSHPPSSLSSASCSCRPTGLPPPRHLRTVAPLSPLLDRDSPPLSPPPAAGLIDSLPGHRSSATALEHRRIGPFSLPHRRRLSPVRTPPPHLA
jgi:hypothetical protein